MEKKLVSYKIQGHMRHIADHFWMASSFLTIYLCNKFDPGASHFIEFKALFSSEH